MFRVVQLSRTSTVLGHRGAGVPLYCVGSQSFHCMTTSQDRFLSRVSTPQTLTVAFYHHHQQNHNYLPAARFYAQQAPKSTASTTATPNQKPTTTATTDSETTLQKSTDSQPLTTTTTTSLSPATNRVTRVWVWVKEGALHYWAGGRLLVKNVQLSSRYLLKSLQGVPLSRREDRMLRRTLTDLLRLIPFAAFVIIPFMEFLLPVALKLFPNMLPSTFEDKMKKQEDIRKRLRIKLKMAEVLQQSMKDMAEEVRSRNVPGSASAAELQHFMTKVRNGELLNTAYLLRFSKLFDDEFTLDSLPREQLVALCKYMNIQPFGTKMLLRMRLERKLQEIRQDDKDIAWEGVRSLTLSELQQACLMRGMRPYLPRPQLEQQLEQWLELSRHNVPPSLLIMSRIFMFTTADLENSADTLASAMLSIPEDAVEELVMDKRISAYDKFLSNAERLEFILEQEQRIRQEEEEDKAVTKPASTVMSPKPAQPALATEAQIKEICEAILLLSSPSAFNLELEELQKLKDQIQTSATNVPGSSPAFRNKGFVSGLINNIQKDLSNADKSHGQAVRVLDSDNDGIVRLHELESATSRLQNHPNPDLVARLFQIFDPDGDGVIKLTDVRRVVDKLADGATTRDVLGPNWERPDTKP
eukprot:c11437_g2_i3.p1 GENE.c11437_g2_i3~~c11437_g2_i3.p1  ORF type:complete len:642 (+),score=187.12 c11437_g2_i3:232-2157(+)